MGLSIIPTCLKLSNTTPPISNVDTHLKSSQSRDITDDIIMVNVLVLLGMNLFYLQNVVQHRKNLAAGH